MILFGYNTKSSAVSKVLARAFDLVNLVSLCCVHFEERQRRVSCPRIKWHSNCIIKKLRMQRNLLDLTLLLLLPWSVLMQDVLVKELFLSTPRMGFTSIEVDGRIYLAGGLTNGNGFSAAIDVYNIAEQKWNNSLALSSPRAYVTPVHIQPNIFFIGGWNQVSGLKAFSYDSTANFFNAINASKIQNPSQTSISGSTLFVVGYHNVEFLNLNDTASGWYTDEDLTNVMQRLAGGIIFSHDNLIFVVGGYNVSTRQFSNDAWMYNVESANLTRYRDVIAPFDYVIGGETLLFFGVDSNVAAVWMPGSRCILFNQETSTWLNLNVTDANNIVSVLGFTFIFNDNGFYTVAWTNPTEDPTFTLAIGRVAYSLGFEQYAAYFVTNADLTVNSNVFNNGVWTSTNSSNLLPIENVISKLEWPTHGVAFATENVFYFFGGTLSNFKVTGVRRLILSLPDADVMHVICTGSNSDTSQVISYTPALNIVRNVERTVANPRVSYNGILFDFGSLAAVGVDDGVALTGVFPTFMGLISRWVVQGPYFLTFAQQQFEPSPSDLVDIYNYKTGVWTSTSHPNICLISGYAQAFNMNGLLTILTGVNQLTYSITENQWNAVVFSTEIFSSFLSPLALQVSDTAYVADRASIQLQIFANGSAQTQKITEENSPLQLVLNTKYNQILISSNSTTIYRWNIDDQTHDIFLLPRDEVSGLMMASSGNFLLVSTFGYEFTFDYRDLSSSLWTPLPGLENYIRPATMKTFTVNNTELIMVAGGDDKFLNFYTDSVKVLDLSSLTSLSVPLKSPVESIASPVDTINDINVPLIVGLVVPLGALLIAGALIVFLLIRRRQKKKAGSLTIGLESNYGRWFIPFNQLTFGEQLGQGGSGQVFKGTWKNTVVALKVSMTQANQSVIRELELMMQLRPHPNVVQLLGFSVHPETDSVILVIELCDQGALASILNGKHDFQLKHKLSWLAGIAKGLNHLHSNNVVHRDVAARNVLIHRNEPKLTDFGMSRIVDDQKQHGTTKSELGPIKWMSPESLRDKEYSVKSDVWSFGILAYEIITQQEPHAGEDPIEIGRLIRDEGRTPQLPAACPKEITSVIQSCWQMDPSKRPNIEQITSKLEKMASELEMI